MFCHKCGAQIAEGAAFCHKCGTKAVYTDTSQATTETPAPIAEPQQTGAVRPEPAISEDTLQASSNEPTLELESGIPNQTSKDEITHEFQLSSIFAMLSQKFTKNFTFALCSLFADRKVIFGRLSFFVWRIFSAQPLKNKGPGRISPALCLNTSCSAPRQDRPPPAYAQWWPPGRCSLGASSPESPPCSRRSGPRPPLSSPGFFLWCSGLSCGLHPCFISSFRPCS